MDNEEVAIRARQLITERSEGSVDIARPRIYALIPTALETWTRGCFENREKRELLKREFTAEVVDGELDLSTFLNGTDGRINLKELKQTSIYDEDDKPYTWLNSHAQLRADRPRQSNRPACFLEGSKLYTRNTSGSLTADQDIRFTVTSYPADVTELPKELEHDFIVALASLVMASEK